VKSECSLDAEKLSLLLHGSDADLASGLGDEHLITGQVTGGGVVSTVRDSPRVVRDEESRVDDPASSVVDGLGRGVGLVTSLVAACQLRVRNDVRKNLPDDPKTGADETGAEHVGGVQRDLGGLVRNSAEVATG